MMAFESAEGVRVMFTNGTQFGGDAVLMRAVDVLLALPGGKRATNLEPITHAGSAWAVMVLRTRTALPVATSGANASAQCIGAKQTPGRTASSTVAVSTARPRRERIGSYLFVIVLLTIRAVNHAV